MKNYLAGISLFGFLIASVQAAPDASPAPSPSSSSSPVAMKDFTYKETGIGFSMPGEPTVSVSSVDTAVGAVKAHSYVLGSGVSALMVMVNLFPEKGVKVDPMKVLEGARDGAVANAKGKITAQKNITIDENPGLEFQFESGKWHGSYRIYMVGSRLYQLVSLSPLDTPLLPGTDQFFASFHLLKP